MPVTVGRLALAYVGARRARGEFNAVSARDMYGRLLSLSNHVGADRPPAALTRAQFEAWLRAKRVSPSTKRNLISSARGFSLWLVEEGYLKRDFTAGVAGPKQPRQAPRGMPDSDVAKLLAACPDARGRLIVQLMRQQGCRCVEVSRLEVGDFDWEDMTVHLVGKGGHGRTLPLTAVCARAVEEHLRNQPGASGPLIRHAYHPDRPLGPKAISAMVSAWAEDAGIHGAGDGRTAHSLRHRFAQAMVANGANLRTVQHALGHASLATTSRYVGLASLSEMREAMEGPQAEPTRRASA